MNTLERIYSLLIEEFKPREVYYKEEPVEAGGIYKSYTCSFLPTVLPEQLEDEFFFPAILSLVLAIKEEISGEVLIRPLKDARYNYKFVSVDIEHEEKHRGVWTITLMVQKIR